jgi:hypothetical protein
MNEAGFKLSLRHYTLIGKQMIAAGQHPEAICHNAVFRPAPGHPALRAAA